MTHSTACHSPFLFIRPAFNYFHCRVFLLINKDILKAMQTEKKRKTIDDSADPPSKLIKSDQAITNTPSLPNPPTVVHLRRSKGKIVQDCDVYIGRACNMGGWRLSQSKWHNPYSVKQYGRDGALDRYKTYIESNTNNLLNDLHELAGNRLGCWCKPDRCHGDILRELFRKQVQHSKKSSD